MWVSCIVAELLQSTWSKSGDEGDSADTHTVIEGLLHLFQWPENRSLLQRFTNWCLLLKMPGQSQGHMTRHEDKSIYIYYIMLNCTVKSCVSGFSWANNSVNLLHVTIFYSNRLDIAIGIPNGSCIETVCMAHLIGAPVLVKTVALLPRTSRTLYGAFRGCMGVQHGQ